MPGTYKYMTAGPTLPRMQTSLLCIRPTHCLVLCTSQSTNIRYAMMSGSLSARPVHLALAPTGSVCNNTIALGNNNSVGLGCNNTTVLSCNSTTVLGCNTTVSAGSNTSDFYAPIRGIEAKAKTPSQERLGEQDFKVCCSMAVNYWKDHPKDSHVVEISKSQSTELFDNKDDLAKAQQFPCGPPANDSDHLPQVKVSLRWCKASCGGWEKSKTKGALTARVQPFVGFILPVAIFCLNVRALSWLLLV